MKDNINPTIGEQLLKIVEDYDRKIKVGEYITDYDKEKLKDILCYSKQQATCGNLFYYITSRIEAINKKLEK